MVMKLRVLGYHVPMGLKAGPFNHGRTCERPQVAMEFNLDWFIHKLLRSLQLELQKLGWIRHGDVLYLSMQSLDDRLLELSLLEDLHRGKPFMTGLRKP